MKLYQHQFEFLKDLAILIQYAERLGFELTGGELERKKEMQDIYFKDGRSKTLDSLHLKKLAIDLNLFIAGVYQTSSEAYRVLGLFWESLSPYNRWGGNFTTIKDGNHFERNPDKKVRLV